MSRDPMVVAVTNAAEGSACRFTRKEEGDWHGSQGIVGTAVEPCLITTVFVVADLPPSPPIRNSTEAVS